MCVIPKKESSKSKIKRENVMHDNLSETKRIKVSNGFITFTKFFKFLGHVFSHDLQDETEVASRVSSACRTMGRINYFWKYAEVESHSKFMIFMAMPMNLLSWGCESWSLKESILILLNMLIHRSMRRTLGITMLEVKEDQLKNTRIRKTFFDIPDIWRMKSARQLGFVGKIVRNSMEKIPSKL